MKKVCIISSQSVNNEPTVYNRIFAYLKALNEGDYKVLIVSNDNEKANFPNATYEHHPIYSEEPASKSFIKRAFHEFFYTFRILLFSKKLEAQLYLLTIPSMFLLFNSYLIKKKKLILDVRDLTWKYLGDKKIIENIASYIFEFAALRAFSNFERIVVTNETEKQYFHNHKINVDINYNGITEKQFYELSKIKPKEKKNKNIKIFYVGKVGIAQDLSFIIEVASENTSCHFHIVGFGAQYEDMKRDAQKKNLTNLFFHGKAKWAEVIEYYDEADILYAQLAHNYEMAMPSKLYQYLCCNRYVIYGGGGEAYSKLKKFNNCTVIEPSSITQLSNAIKEYKDNFINIDNTQYENNRTIIRKKYLREGNARNIVALF